MDDDDIIEIIDETPEKEAYYNRLGVKPRILPNIKLGDKIKLNRKSPISKDTPLTVQLDGDSTVNINTDNKSIIPQIEDNKNTSQ